MREDVQAKIRAAAEAATDEVWGKSVIPEGVHFGGVSHAMMAVEDHSHAAGHEAVRAKCAELQVDPRDYYRADPESAVICEPACLDKWPEISVAVSQPDPDADFLVRRAVQHIQTGSAAELGIEDYETAESETQGSGFYSGLGY